MLHHQRLLTVCTTIADAFLSMHTFEYTCRIQVDALAGGGELVPVNPAILAGMGEVMKIPTAGQGAQLAWPALLRRVESGWTRVTSSEVWSLQEASTKAAMPSSTVRSRRSSREASSRLDHPAIRDTQRSRGIRCESNARRSGRCPTTAA